MTDLTHLFPKIKEAIPDITVELQKQVAEGNQVASFWILRGTHRGTLFGIPGTGRTIEFQNVSIAEVENGRVVRYNSETGWLTFLMQIGELPRGK